MDNLLDAKIKANNEKNKINNDIEHSSFDDDDDDDDDDGDDDDDFSDKNNKSEHDTTDLSIKKG